MLDLCNLRNQWTRLVAVAVAAVLFAALPAAASVLPGGAEVIMDAAEVYADGTEMEGFAAVRTVIDNSEGAAPLTGVSFGVTVHNGATLYDISGWGPADSANPWFGAISQETFVIVGNVAYLQCIVLHGLENRWGPAWMRYPVVDGVVDGSNPIMPPLSDMVPQGMVWDIAMKLPSGDGGRVELFSTAEGTLTTSTGTITLFDTDRRPQTAIPEPATLSLLAAGLFALVRSRR
jgi:hypothetical protein